MIRTVSAILKHSSYPRPSRAPHPLPQNKVILLRRPELYGAFNQPLDNSYLENLIQDHLVIHDQAGFQDRVGNDFGEDVQYEYARRASYHFAAEPRAFYLSLNDDYKKKLEDLVRVFEIATTPSIDDDQITQLEKSKNLEMIKGMIIAGGEIRVVAATAHVMAIKVITSLLGIKLKELYGISAGGFQAVGQAVNARNSSVLSTTVDTPFHKFKISAELSPKEAHQALQDWIESLLQEGYSFQTGKGIDQIRAKHIQELGRELTVVVGTRKEGSLWLGSKYIPFEDASDIVASANLATIFHNIGDLTFGDCYKTNGGEKKVYRFDPGLLLNTVPSEPLIHGISDYAKGNIQRPPFYFVVGNQLVPKDKIPLHLQNPKIKSRLGRLAMGTLNTLESILQDPIDKLENIGAGRLRFIAHCFANIPESMIEGNDQFKAGDIALLKSGHPDSLNISPFEREVIIAANIPTSNFQESEFMTALDQLHHNLVDLEYLSSHGKRGKSPMQLYIDDVNQAYGINKSHNGNGQQTNHSPIDHSRLLACTK